MNIAANLPDLLALANQADAKRRRRADVIVVGGGPAGCSTALALARTGIAVTILERSRYEAFRVGETLPPEGASF